MSKKICVCVQARLSSKRLPEKVLKKVNELNILELLTKRLSKARDPSQIYILTSNDKSDNKLVKFCQSKGLKFFRGDLDNVFKRYRDFLKINNYQALVRISADSPFIDFKLIEKFMEIYKKKKPDILTNVYKRTFPMGQSIELIKTSFFIKHQ